MDETHTVRKLMLICIDGRLLGVGVGLFTHVRRWPSVCVGVSLFQWPPACLLLCCVWLGLAGTRNYSGMQGQGVNRHSRVTRNDSTCKTPFNFHHSLCFTFSMHLSSPPTLKLQQTCNISTLNTVTRDADNAHFKSISGYVMGGTIIPYAAFSFKEL